MSMHPQTRRLFYETDKLQPGHVYTPMHNPTTLSEQGAWDVFMDELHDHLDIGALVEWMIQAEREVVISHGEHENSQFGDIESAVNYHIDDRIHEDVREYVDAKVDVGAFAAALSIDEAQVRQRLYDRVEDDVRAGLDDKL